MGASQGDVMATTNEEREMRVAVDRIVGFAKQFDEAHLNLACHAAFPLVLTPDLLYQIWAHFAPEAPWTAVARVLLSRLCRQVGYEMYEMDIAVRNLLLKELKEQFGQKRFDELAEFLMDYVTQRLTGDDSDTQDLAQAQEWTALAYTKPDEVARELAESLSERVKQDDMAEVFRLALLVETFAEPLVEAGFKPLLVYASGISSFARGDLKTATNQLSNVLIEHNQLEIAGVTLPIPEDVEAIQRERLLRDLPFDLEAPDFIYRGSEKEKIMPRLVISTIGTSLITNQINREIDPKNWYFILRNTANLTLDELSQYHPDVQYIIQVLKERAIENLNTGDIEEIRLASTEINVVYALYQEQLERGKQDIHWLIATDTAIGREIANTIKSFLEIQGLNNVNIYLPKGFSTNSIEVFTEGIGELISWLDEIIPDYKNAGYRISFNLTASFRALQAYMDIIGMLYADELIYIFEGQRSKLITIPKIPLQIDSSLIQPVQFALMDAGASIPIEELRSIPELFLFVVDDEATLSNWGQLIWNKSKKDFLTHDLLAFPRLRYEPAFLQDYEKIRDMEERVKLQETLAKVSHLLIQSKGDITILKQDGGLQYTQYSNIKVGRFRVNQGLRISCVFSEGVLQLRRYGSHTSVNKSP
jgi:CRISPR/Cas system-associated protein Csm6